MAIDQVTATLLHTALTGSGDVLLTLLQNSAHEIVKASLKNPALTENHLFAVLQRKDLSEEIVKSISRSAVAESSHRIKYAIASHPATPAHQLSIILPQLYLFELLNICYLPHVTPDQKLAAERVIIQRLPLTPLGNRLTLARRATHGILEVLLKEADPRLLEICLANPHLKEGTVFQFLRSGKAGAESISLVARHPRWQNLPNIREAILTHPQTPLVWFTLWLPKMKIPEIKKLLSSNRLNSAQRKVVEERLKGH